MALFATIQPLFVLSGFAVGFLVGMTGVGGGSLMTPLLILLFHVHPVTAVGTDLIYAAVTKTGVDLNSATEGEIAKVPGINKMMAKRIVAARPFLSLNDLIRIGVSKKTIENLKPHAAGGKSPTK